ncbi:hypothetical protein [Streptomyces antimicrobicus]|uniref:Uncharacterized protein n=1 Tax=Streptomyces antimicrobicus TaxID=2883108 RepID=A0ABS8B031_9ACTN|nr:hypothetical protein [Streptomyces antimicrobicus]MCB5177925.1 hypothetical protein [Streptomyces antimicrobicus]
MQTHSAGEEKLHLPAGEDAIAAAREELRTHLPSDAAYSKPHAFEAGGGNAVLRH